MENNKNFCEKEILPRFSKFTGVDLSISDITYVAYIYDYGKKLIIFFLLIFILQLYFLIPL